MLQSKLCTGCVFQIQTVQCCSAAVGGMCEMEQTLPTCYDIFSLEMQPLEDSAPETGHNNPILHTVYIFHPKLTTH